MNVTKPVNLSKSVINGLSAALSRMDTSEKSDKEQYVSVPRPISSLSSVSSSVSPSSSLSLNGSDSLGVSSPDVKRDKNGRITSFARSSEDQQKLIALYRVGSTGSGMKVKHYQFFYPLNAGNMGNILTTTPYVCNDIAQGTNYWNQIGYSFKMKKLVARIKAVWELETNNLNPVAQNPQSFRLIVFLDKMPLVNTPTFESTGPTSSDFTSMTLGPPGSVTVNPYPWASSTTWNPNTHGIRYQILYDEVHDPPTNSTYTNGGGYQTVAASKYIPIDIDLHDTVSQVSNPVNTIPDTNALYFMFIADRPSTVYSNNTPAIYSSWDLQFYDRLA